MKIICEKEKLLKALNSVNIAVATKTTKPILEGTLIQTNINEIKLTTYNMEIGVEYIIDSVINEEGSTVVNSNMFSEIIRKLPNTEIQIYIEDNKLVIECENSIYKLSTMSPDLFPELPKINVENLIEIEQISLKDMIRKTIFAVSNEDSRPIYKGCLLEVKNNKMNFVALDGYRLAWVNKNLHKDSKDFVAIIPGRFLNEINKILTESFEDIKIGIDKTHALFEMDNCRIVTSLLDGEFLKYEDIISDDWKTRVKVNKKKFQDCLERVSLISSFSMSNNKFSIKMLIELEKITILCKNQISEAKEEIYTTSEGRDLETKVNVKNVLEALRVIDNEEIYINFNKIQPGFTIKPIGEEDTNYIHLIIPAKDV